ncbi:hypothetical protein CsatB_017539 [Cannabis sativa]
MGEIDTTKPIESVQAAISLFSEKCDHQNNWLTANNECERNRELECVLKELANCKVQLEAKEAAYMQTLHKLEHTKEKVDELSILIENSDIEREIYVNEYKNTSARIEKFESEAKEMAVQLSEATNICEQLSNELKATQAELICKEAQFDSAREAEVKALTQVEVMEKASAEEREKCLELLRKISELNEANFMLKASECEAQKEKIAMASEKDMEIELAKIALDETKEKLEDVERDVEMMEEMEGEFVFKMILGNVLELKLVEANEELTFLSKKLAADTDSELKLKLIREELEVWERKSLSQEALIEAFKMEVNQVKMELRSANELVSQLMDDVEILTYDILKAKTEINEMKRKETEAQVEIALMKTELQKESRDRNDGHIKGDDQIWAPTSDNKHELETLRKELDAALAKVAEFRNRGEQANFRAEMAEKAKAAIEDQLRKWREDRQKKKLALVAVPSVASSSRNLISSSIVVSVLPLVYECILSFNRIRATKGHLSIFPGSDGLFGSCLTEDCGYGMVECNGAGAALPTTLAEFTLGTGRHDLL